MKTPRKRGDPPPPPSTTPPPTYLDAPHAPRQRLPLHRARVRRPRRRLPDHERGRPVGVAVGAGGGLLLEEAGVVAVWWLGCVGGGMKEVSNTVGRSVGESSESRAHHHHHTIPPKRPPPSTTEPNPSIHLKIKHILFTYAETPFESSHACTAAASALVALPE